MADWPAAFTHLQFVAWLLMALPLPPMALADAVSVLKKL
jgi:hypothetical protein